MIEQFAWGGSILLALCAVPEAYSSWKRGRSDCSWGFLLMWGFGELFTLVYVLSKKDLPLILNYGLNIIFICVIIRYKWKPKTKEINEVS